MYGSKTKTKETKNAENNPKTIKKSLIKNILKLTADNQLKLLKHFSNKKKIVTNH